MLPTQSTRTPVSPDTNAGMVRSLNNPPPAAPNAPPKQRAGQSAPTPAPHPSPSPTPDNPAPSLIQPPPVSASPATPVAAPARGYSNPEQSASPRRANARRTPSISCGMLAMIGATANAQLPPEAPQQQWLTTSAH